MMFSYVKNLLRSKLGNQKGVTMVEYVVVLVFVVSVAALVFDNSAGTGLGKAIKDGISKVETQINSGNTTK